MNQTNRNRTTTISLTALSFACFWSLSTAEEPAAPAPISPAVESALIKPLAPFDPENFQAPSNHLAGGMAATLGATHGSTSSAPAMIGDFFGGSFLFSDDEGGNGMSGGERIATVTIPVAGGDRRFKIAENVSPMPRDRVFLNYNHFENALNDRRGRPVSLERFAPGLEKTFFDEQTSIEARLPFARGLSSTQDFNSDDTQGLELSNLSIAFKAILLGGDRWLISGGTTLTLPTGDGYAEAFDGDKYFFIDNDAVHLAPYIGWLIQPNSDWFAQGFIQTDFDLNGNRVRSAGLGDLGKIQDQNLLFVDASIGRWLIQLDRHGSRQAYSGPLGNLNGIAAITELHYTMTMNDADRVADITNPFQHVDVLNLTAALHFQFGRSSLRFGAAAPLRNDEERLYDAEIIAQYSRGF